MSRTVNNASIHAFIEKELIDFGVDRESIDDSSKLDDLEVDSLDVAELTQVIKRAYGIEISRKEFDPDVTVGDVINLICLRLGLC